MLANVIIAALLASALAILAPGLQAALAPIRRRDRGPCRHSTEQR